MPQNQWVLITGASYGIGYELSRLFAKDGYHLILVARSDDKLNDVARQLYDEYKIKVITIAKDLSESNSPREIFEQLRHDNIQVHILVNNAGFGLHGEFLSNDLNVELNMIHLNVLALVEMTKLFLPQMIKQKFGRIFNIASVAAFKPGPCMAIYYASKAFVVSFSEALRGELLGTGVSVSVLCPGPTKTEFQKRAEIQSMPTNQMTMMQAQEVARIGYQGLMKNKMIIVPGWKMKLIVFVLRILPRSWSLSLVCRVQKAY